MRRALIIAGAQRFEPTVGPALAALGIEGPIAAVTAGWQERESEDDELRAHFGGRATNLRLHERADALFQLDPELREAHRQKQAMLRHRQDFYRIRLEHELAANHVILQRRAPPEVLAEEARASVSAIRILDQYHLAQCAQLHRDFDLKMKPFERRVVARHRDEIAEVLEKSVALAIAGGHVATLLYRLRLFGIAELLGDQAIVAWSAGAMAISERVVLFHDSPPQGPGASEVLDTGLGLVRGIVPLPHPETRLRLDDPERVGLLARRFAPARCLALRARSTVRIEGETLLDPHGEIDELQADGSVRPVAGGAELTASAELEAEVL